MRKQLHKWLSLMLIVSMVCTMNKMTAFGQSAGQDVSTIDVQQVTKEDETVHSEAQAKEVQANAEEDSQHEEIVPQSGNVSEEEDSFDTASVADTIVAGEKDEEIAPETIVRTDDFYILTENTSVTANGEGEQRFQFLPKESGYYLFEATIPEVGTDIRLYGASPVSSQDASVSSNEVIYGELMYTDWSDKQVLLCELQAGWEYYYIVSTSKTSYSAMVSSYDIDSLQITMDDSEIDATNRNAESVNLTGLKYGTTIAGKLQESYSYSYTAEYANDSPNIVGIVNGGYFSVGDFEENELGERVFVPAGSLAELSLGYHVCSYTYTDINKPYYFEFQLIEDNIQSFEITQAPARNYVYDATAKDTDDVSLSDIVWGGMRFCVTYNDGSVLEGDYKALDNNGTFRYGLNAKQSSFYNQETGYWEYDYELIPREEEKTPFLVSNIPHGSIVKGDLYDKELPMYFQFNGHEVCTQVLIRENPFASLEITQAPAKRTYLEGQSLFLDYSGMEVTLHKTDGTDEVFAYDSEEYNNLYNIYHENIYCTISGNGLDYYVGGTYEATVSFMGKQDSFTFEVVDSPVQSIDVDYVDEPCFVEADTILDLPYNTFQNTKVKVTMHFADGTPDREEIFTPDNSYVNCFVQEGVAIGDISGSITADYSKVDFMTPGNYEILFSFMGAQAGLPFTVGSCPYVEMNVSEGATAIISVLESDEWCTFGSTYQPLKVTLTRQDGTLVTTEISPSYHVMDVDGNVYKQMLYTDTDRTWIQDVLMEKNPRTFTLDWEDVDVFKVGEYNATLYYGQSERFSAPVTIKVVDEPKVKSGSIAVEADQTVAYEGQYFYLDSMEGKTLTLQYEDGTQQQVTQNYYQEPITGYHRNVSLYVETKTLPENFQYGDYLESEEQDGTIVYRIKNTGMLAHGTYDVIVDWGTGRTSYPFTVKELPVKSVVWSTTGEKYPKSNFQHDGVYMHLYDSDEVLVTLDNGIEATLTELVQEDDYEAYRGLADCYRLFYITPSGKTVDSSSISLSEVGTYQAGIRLGSATAIGFSWEVKENPVKDIVITNPPTKTTYCVYDNNGSDDADMSGCTFRLKYADGTLSREYGKGESYTHQFRSYDGYTYTAYFSDKWEYGAIEIYEEKMDRSLYVSSSLLAQTTWDDETEEELYEAGDATIRVSVFNIEADIAVTMEESAYTEMKIVKTPDRTEYPGSGINEFESITLDGMEVELTTKDGEKEICTISDSEGSISYAYALLKGNSLSARKKKGKTVTVSWRNLTDSFDTTTGLPTGVEAVSLTMDETKKVEAGPEAFGYYSFTPDEDGIYYFASFGDRSTKGILLDETAAILAGGSARSGYWEDDEFIEEEEEYDYGFPFTTSKTDNYEFGVALIAGETYYLVTSKRESDYLIRVSQTAVGNSMVTLNSVSLTVNDPVSGSSLFVPEFANPFDAFGVTVDHDYYSADMSWDVPTENKYNESNKWGTEYSFVYGITPSLHIRLTPYGGMKFSANTEVKINGKRPATKLLHTNGVLELTYKAPTLDYQIVLPQDEDGKYQISAAGKKEMVVKPGASASFTVTLQDAKDMENLVVKAAGNILSATKEGLEATYTIANVQENMTVSVRISEVKIDEASEIKQHLVTYYDHTEKYDAVIVESGKTIAESEDKRMPKLESYVNGSNQFFTGWYAQKDINGNGCGRQITDNTVIVQDTNVYAGYIQGIFRYTYNGMSLTYKITKALGNGRYSVEVSNSKLLKELEGDNLTAERAEDGNGVVTIPAGFTIEDMEFDVTAIAEGAFDSTNTQAAGITALVLPDTITAIGDGAFAGCNALLELSLPDSIETIGQDIVAQKQEGEEITILCSPALYEDMQADIDKMGKASKIEIILSDGNSIHFNHYLSDAVTVSANAIVDEKEAPIVWEYVEDDENVTYSLNETSNKLTIRPKHATTEPVVVKATYQTAGSVKLEKAIRVTVGQIDIEDGGDYSISVSGVNSSYQYAGAQIKPVPVVVMSWDEDEEYTLVAGTDYEVTYQGNNAVTKNARVVVTGKGNFTGEIVQTFRIRGDKVTGVTFSQTELTMTVGEEKALIATVAPAAAENKKVGFVSDNEKVASVDKNGKVTAIGKGTAKITVTTAEGEYKANCVVTVKEKTSDGGSQGGSGGSQGSGGNGDSGDGAQGSGGDGGNRDGSQQPDTNNIAATKLTVSHKKLTLAKGRSFKLETTMAPANTTDKITFTSSDPKIVSVNAKGVVKALKAGKSATITVTSTSGKKATCKVTVPKKEIKAKSIKLNKTKVTIKAGKTFKLKAKLNPVKSTDNVTYSSKSKKIATVSNTGVITAVKKGKTTITAKTTSGKKATCVVTVK